MPDATPVSEIANWHAHVYYDVATKAHAAVLRDWIAARFAVQMGRWHDVQVGPHPVAMYQVAFANDLFATLVPFMALNRHGLTILVHPNTDDPHDDHLVHAIWMGGVLDLDASMLPRSLRATGRTPDVIVPNTKSQ